MLTKLIEAAKKITPAHIKNILTIYKSNKRSNKSKANRNAIIKNWQVQGKPLPTPHEIKQVIIEHYQKFRIKNFGGNRYLHGRHDRS